MEIYAYFQQNRWETVDFLFLNGKGSRGPAHRPPAAYTKWSIFKVF